MKNLLINTLVALGLSSSSAHFPPQKNTPKAVEEILLSPYHIYTDILAKYHGDYLGRSQYAEIFQNKRDISRKMSLVGVDMSPDRDNIEKARQAREYLERYVTPRDILRQYPLDKYRIIPLILEGGEIVHIAREKHPSSQEPDNWLLRWVGPIESGYFLETIGISNGGKTTFRVRRSDSGSEIGILALRYPDHDGIDKGTIRERPNIMTPWTDIFYARTPELLDAGVQYQRGLIERTGDRIIDHDQRVGEKEKFFHDEEIREISSETIRSLILVENIEPIILYGENDINSLLSITVSRLRHLFVQLGLHGKNAFDRESSARARGLLQIIPESWNSLVQQITDPLISMGLTEKDAPRDHEKNIMVSFKHLSHQLETIRGNPRVYQWLNGIGKPYLPYFLAAGYNSGNGGRISDLDKAISLYPDNVVKVFTHFFWTLSNELPEQTRTYMYKLQLVNKILKIFAYLPDLPEGYKPIPDVKSPKKDRNKSPTNGEEAKKAIPKKVKKVTKK